MKVSRGFSLELEDMKLIEMAAKEMKTDENEALARLIRNGYVRVIELERQFSRLVPDDSDLR